MQTMSAKWLPAMLADVLPILCYGEVWTPPTAANPAGTFVARLQVVSGTVTIDATNAIRRTAQTLTLVPYPVDPVEGVPIPLPVPTVAKDSLFPDGNELIIYKGVVYSDSSTEVASLGRYLMEDVEVYNAGSSGNVYVELSGRDRGATISRAKFTVPYTSDGVSSFATQLTTLIQTAVPGFTLFSITPTTLIPAAMSFNIGDDPWLSALQMCASIGYELFPDAQGVIVARPTLNPKTLPVSATYQTGLPTSIATSIQRSFVTTSVPNISISMAQGSNVPTPLISYWWDSDPLSPTFYNSTVPVPGSNMTSLPSIDPSATYPVTVQSSQTSAATTQLANDQIAQSMGLSALGTQETMDLKIRDNPAHDVEDVVNVIDAAISLNGNYCLDTITISLDSSSDQEMKGRLVVA